MRAYATLPFAVLALAGGALAVVGAVKHNPWYAYGGLGGVIVFTSVAVGIAPGRHLAVPLLYPP